jgi:WD40 repeat protein
MALSSDGQTLAVATPYYVELRQAATNEFITAFFPFEDAPTFIHQLAFDQSNQTLLVYSARKAEVVAWDITAATAVTALTNANNFAFAPQAQMAVTDDGVSLQVWQWQDGAFTAVATLEIPPEIVDESRLLAISPDGQYVAVGHNVYGMTAAVWRVDDGELLHILDNLVLRPREQGKRLAAPPQVSGPGRDHLSYLQFSPDSQTLAITTGFQNLMLWDVASGQSLRQLDEVGNGVIFAPDGTAVATWQHTLSQWRIDDGNFINTLNQHIGAITDLALVPQRNQLAIASGDRFVYLRRLNDGALASGLRAGVGNRTYYVPPMVMGVDVTADGNTLVSASNDAYRLWNLDDYSMTELLPPPRGDIGPDEVVMSFDGQYILGKEHDAPLKLWLMENGVWQETGGGPASSPSAMAFSPTDNLLATTEYFSDGLLLWQPNPLTWQDLPLDSNLNDVDLGSVDVFAFSGNGRILAAGTDEGSILLWSINDALEAEFLRFLDLPDDVSYINSITFSQDNNLLIARTAYDVWFLSMDDGRLLYRHKMVLPGIGVLLSEDGRYLITGHTDGSVRFWMVP